MKLNPEQFLDLPPQYTHFRNAAVAILPVPYEGGVSYGTGTAAGPDAVIEASGHLELYDEVLKAEAYRMGISTVMPPEILPDAERMNAAVFETTKNLIGQNKFVVMLGGDHSISSACLRALCKKYNRISVIQFDAHADLRDSYQGSLHSHACAMSRIRELTASTLQVGIRSLSLREARRIERENLAVCTMAAVRSGNWKLLRFPDRPSPAAFYGTKPSPCCSTYLWQKTSSASIS